MRNIFMIDPRSEVGRLKVAAKAVEAEAWLQTHQGLLVFLIALGAIILLLPVKGFYAPYFDAVLIVGAILVAVSQRLDWRFKFYVPALWWFAAAALYVLLNTSEPLFDRAHFGALCVLFGLVYLTYAGPYSRANSPGWMKELAIAESCWERLSERPPDDDIIEFSVKSSLYGVFLYRLMRYEAYWVVFRRRSRLWRWVRELTFYELNAVDFVTSPSGERTVRIGKKTLRVLNLAGGPHFEGGGGGLPTF